jgi:hypothetical protein
MRSIMFNKYRKKQNIQIGHIHIDKSKKGAYGAIICMIDCLKKCKIGKKMRICMQISCVHIAVSAMSNTSN